jgi:hypothetical protein
MLRERPRYLSCSWWNHEFRAHEWNSHIHGQRSEFSIGDAKVSLQIAKQVDDSDKTAEIVE